MQLVQGTEPVHVRGTRSKACTGANYTHACDKQPGRTEKTLPTDVDGCNASRLYVVFYAFGWLCLVG